MCHHSCLWSRCCFFQWLQGQWLWVGIVVCLGRRSHESPSRGHCFAVDPHVGEEKLEIQLIVSERSAKGSAILCLIHYWTWWDWQPSYLHFLYPLGWLHFNLQDASTWELDGAISWESLEPEASFPLLLPDQPPAHGNATLFPPHCFLWSTSWVSCGFLSVILSKDTVFLSMTTWWSWKSPGLGIREKKKGIKKKPTLVSRGTHCCSPLRVSVPGPVTTPAWFSRRAS